MPLPNDSSDYLNATETIVLVQKCFESKGFMTFQKAVDHGLLIATVVASMCNILVIVCGFRLFKRTDDTLHLFVICMTFGDLLLTAFAVPHELINRRYEVTQSVNLCSAVQFTYWLGIAISGLALILLNIDKLIYFRWPLKYLMMSKKHAVYLCLAAIGISLGYVGYVWLAGLVFVHDKACVLTMVPGENIFYGLFTLCFCILPVVSSAFLSIYLFRLTRQRTNRPGSDGGQVDTSTLKQKIPYCQEYETSLECLATLAGLHIRHDGVDRLQSASISRLQHFPHLRLRLGLDELRFESRAELDGVGPHLPADAECDCEPVHHVFRLRSVPEDPDHPHGVPKQAQEYRNKSTGTFSE